MPSLHTKENDFSIIAEALDISIELVRKVERGERKDHHNIFKAMLIVDEHQIASRESLIKKLIKIKI